MMGISANARRYDSVLVLIGIVALSVLTWAYMLEAAVPSNTHRHGTAPMPTWDGSLLALSMLMWSIMMVAMMLPTATPMILGYLRVQRHRRSTERAQTLTWIFVSGYLLAWTVFSLLAALAQWGLHGLGLLSSAMGSATPLLGGGFLLAAGIFQWSGLKEACLSKCRSPVNFLLNEWREGSGGALVMGLRHGLFCVGCCWMLMLLMFVGGVMSLTWMAAITIYMLAEKVIPGSRLLGRVTGVVLVVAGLLIMGLSLAGVGLTGHPA